MAHLKNPKASATQYLRELKLWQLSQLLSVTHKAPGKRQEEETVKAAAALQQGTGQWWPWQPDARALPGSGSDWQGIHGRW